MQNPNIYDCNGSVIPIFTILLFLTTWIFLVGDVPQGHLVHPDQHIQQETDVMSREHSIYTRCNSVGSINTPSTSNHSTGKNIMIIITKYLPNRITKIKGRKCK